MIFGIYAGLQILGKTIQYENNNYKGLGLLDIHTIFKKEKITKQVTRKIKGFDNGLQSLNNSKISGYEIHQGVSNSNEKCFLYTDKPIGYYKENIYTTYLHDIFNNGIFAAHFLNMIREKKGLPIKKEYYNINYNTLKELEYDKWENHLRNNLDMKQVYKIID